MKSNWFSTNTALHRSKDFAVSLLRLRKIIPEGILPLSESASLFAPLASRRAGVTRYPAPCDFSQGCVRTFLPYFRKSDCLAQAAIVPPLDQCCKYGSIAAALSHLRGVVMQNIVHIFSGLVALSGLALVLKRTVLSSKKTTPALFVPLLIAAVCAIVFCVSKPADAWYDVWHQRASLEAPMRRAVVCHFFSAKVGGPIENNCRPPYADPAFAFWNSARI